MREEKKLPGLLARLDSVYIEDLHLNIMVYFYDHLRHKMSQHLQQIFRMLDEYYHIRDHYGRNMNNISIYYQNDGILRIYIVVSYYWGYSYEWLTLMTTCSYEFYIGFTGGIPKIHKHHRFRMDNHFAREKESNDCQTDEDIKSRCLQKHSIIDPIVADMFKRYSWYKNVEWE